MSGQVQFNQILLNFLGFHPYAAKPNRGMNYGNERSTTGNQTALAEGVTPEFFDIQKFNLSGLSTFIKIEAHQIRLDQNQKPKNFYVMMVYFKERADPKASQNSQKGRRLKAQKGIDKSDANEPKQVIHSIKLEKVYGDFKRLNEHIVDTFQNEIREYERFQNAIKEQQNVHFQVEGPRKQRIISMNFDTSGSRSFDFLTSNDNSNNTIIEKQNEINHIELDDGTT